MRLIVTADADDVGREALQVVAALVAARPRAVLGLAAGATPLGLYRRLVEAQRAGTLDLAGITAIGLDDYLGLPPGHSAACRTCLERNLLEPLALPRAQRRLLGGGAADDPARLCAEHERAIVAAGGIDLQILGIGVNGHIGFNEPGAALDGRTHRVSLAASTREVNRKDFAAGEAVPKDAVTMGIGTILEARRILLLASGAAKAAALAAALEGPVTAMLPASALQRHPDLTVVADRAAAARLSSKDPAARLYPKGDVVENNY